MALPLIQIAFGVVAIIFFQGNDLGLSDIPFDTNIILLGFIAPLLYNEARKANKLELLKNVSPILLLSIGLVGFTTFTVAYPLHFAVPVLSLACCFALGAALGPTDPVAIASLPREIHIGSRRRSILKGESLLNDASGIVAFQFAMMFAITGSVNVSQAIGTFAIEFFGGILAGVVSGFICRGILKLINTYLAEDTVIQILFDIVTPFLVYMLADLLHFSGVVAVVCCGLLVSDTHHVNPFISKKNIALDSIWQSLSFLLNSCLFILLGVNFPAARMDILYAPETNIPILLAMVVFLTFLVYFFRFIWIFAVDYFEAQRKKDELNPNIPIYKQVFKSSMIMTLGGSKGAVTLAVLLTVPLTLPSGAAFPNRSLMILLGSGVIILSLLISNFILPLFADTREVTQKLNIFNKLDSEEEDEILDIFRTVIYALNAQYGEKSKDALRNVISKYEARIKDLKNTRNLPNKLNKEIRLKALKWEEEYALDSYSRGEIDKTLAKRYIRDIDRRRQAVENHSVLWKLKRFFEEGKQDLFAKYNKLKKPLPDRIADDSYLQLKIRGTKYVLERLREAIEVRESISPDNTQELRMSDYEPKFIEDHKPSDMHRIANASQIKTEDIANAMLEYQNMLSVLEQSTSTIKEAAVRDTKSDEIIRYALQLERFMINDKFEKGLLSKNTALRMRQNINLMEIDANNLMLV